MGILTGRPRREQRQWTAAPIIPPFPGTNMYGQVTAGATPQNSLYSPAVWACVSLIANAVSIMPMSLYVPGSGGADDVKAPVQPDFVESPCPGVPVSVWLHQVMVSLLLRGNAYGLYDVPLADGPSMVKIVSPDSIAPRWDAAANAYVFNLRQQDGTLKDVTSMLWHCPGLTMPGEIVGLSPIAYAARALGVDLSSRKFAEDFFNGGGVPKATLTSDQDINQDQADTAKQRLMAATLNREPAVFGRGLTYTPISVKPEESQFLETQQATVSDIARYFSVPAEMIGGKSGSSLTYTTVELNSLQFLTFCVSFWLKRLEDTISPIFPSGKYVKLDESSLLRTDAETQAKVRSQYIAAKVLPPSRILKEMGEPLLTDDEKQELQLVPLGMTATGLPRLNPGAVGANPDPSIAPNISDE